jgi:arginine decarboxylase
VIIIKIAIVSGKSEGPTELNAFDNALIDAGIGDVNLIKVSSMLDGNAETVSLPDFKPGSMVNCVLSSVTSSKKGESITACVGIAIGEKLGCIVEKHSINENPEEVKKEAIFMAGYMMEVRGVAIKDLIIEEISHEVENIGSVVSSVIYVD